MMVIGTLSLTGFGIPFLIGTSGYYSKDAIIEVAYAAHSEVGSFAFVMGIVAAAMTSFYSWRLIFMSFHGKHRCSEETLSHVHESPASMTIPLIVLAFGAVFAGMMFYSFFIGEAQHDFWQQSIFVRHEHEVLEKAHHSPTWVVLAPFVMMAIGFAIAWYFYIRRPELPARLAAQNGLIYNFLYNKWYFDELFDFLFVRPAQRVGRFFWKIGDGWLIDGFGPDGISARVLDVTRGVVRLQSGRIYLYAFVMVIGVMALMTYALYRMGAF
jgi:NADH-quinone oxidoreductase subunit L